MIRKQLLFLHLCTLVNFGLPLPEPSYVSDWQTVKSQSSSQSELTIHHNLNTLPIKVQTEVKVRSHGDVFVFPGMGTGLTDDDHNQLYGGVVTIYNETVVKAFVPNRNNGHPSGVVVYTDVMFEMRTMFLFTDSNGSTYFEGSSNAWDGPSGVDRIYHEAEVRVKVWIETDFPEANFMYHWTNISVYDNITFKEVKHNMSGHPSLAVVQVKFSSGYTSEAEGSSSQQEYQGIYTHTGGVIYGFSNDSFRIWYPKTEPRATLLNVADGWGNQDPAIYEKSGEFRILAWKFPESWIDTIVITDVELVNKNFKIKNMNENLHVLNVETEITTSVLVNDIAQTQMVEASDGANEGFRFYGVGSTVNDGSSGPYGGLIFAYCHLYVTFWRPVGGNSTGHTIQIGGVWNDNTVYQSSDNVSIRINTFSHWNTPSYSYVKARAASYEISNIHNDVLPADQILWQTTSSHLQCIDNCLKDFLCGSFFYHLNSKLCVGYEFPILNSTDVVNFPGMKHFVSSLKYQDTCSYD